MLSNDQSIDHFIPKQYSKRTKNKKQKKTTDIVTYAPGRRTLVLRIITKFRELLISIVNISYSILFLMTDLFSSEVKS